LAATTPLSPTVRDPASSAAAVTAGRGAKADAASPQLKTRIVVIYLLAGLLALVPGLWLRFGEDWLGLAAPSFAAPLGRALEDIRFGWGVRFWLGVTGASLMGLLLLYPLRKIVPGLGFLGSVGAWFHVHMVIGIGAPVAILYHTNFGLGGSNANVALWSMLMVVASGIVGHFVYARASAGFYAGRQQAQEQRAAIVALLEALPANAEDRRQIIAELDAFDADLLTPRRGIVASIAARLRVEQHRRRLAKLIGWHLGHCAQALALDRGQYDELRRVIGQHLHSYVRLARHAASRSLREQVWARWRLLHLPVFLLMVAATVLHVVAVWNMDRPAADVADVRVAAKSGWQPDAIEAILTAPAPRPAQRTARAEAVAKAPPPAVVAAPSAPPPVAAEERVVAAPAPRPVTKRAAPAPAPAPPNAAPPVVADGVTTAPMPLPAQRPTAAAAAVQAERDSRAAIAELERRTGESMMSLGGAKTRSLEQQIAAYKARKEAGQFAHSQAETGFALTGKHVRVDCASCHKVPLKEVRSTEPRQCVACHKKDDVHRGRRPNCAQCHTTNSFRERK
jgi:hypothetical protein